MLFQPGDEDVDLIVVAEGSVEVNRPHLLGRRMPDLPDQYSHMRRNRIRRHPTVG